MKIEETQAAGGEASAPGGGVRRTPSGDERRQALVLAAYDLIAAKGFEGLRVRDVAARGGVNIATLHYYFPSKEALIRGVVDHMLHLFIHLAPPAPDGVEETAVQRLQRELTDQEYELREAPEMFVVLMELQLRALRDPAISAILKEMHEGWRAHIEQICREGVHQGVFRSDLDVGRAASTIIALMKGMTIQAMSGFDRFDIRHVGADLVHWLAGSAAEASTTDAPTNR